MAGEILRQKREALGLDIKAISDQLRIRADYLVAIENDLFAKLPVPVYTIGYIRSYAKYLGIDSEEIILFYTQHLATPESAAIVPVAYSQKRSPIIFYLIPVAIVISVAFAYYFSMQHDNPVSPTVNVPIALPSPKAETLVHSLPVAERPAERNEHTLQIDARDITWLSITFSDGTREELLMRSGNSRTVTFRDKVSLKIGNAGGIDLMLDGRELGSPGNPGQVMTVSYPVSE